MSNAGGAEQGEQLRGIRRLRRLPAAVRSSYLLKVALALVLILSLVAVLGTGIFVQTSETLDANVEETVVNLATLEAREHTRWIDGNERATRLASANGIFARDNATELDTYLESVRDERLQDPSYEIHYVDFRNRTVLASSENSTAQLPEQPWHPRLQFNTLDDVFISAPYTDATGRDVMAFISPVNEVPGRLLVLLTPVDERKEATQAFKNSFTTVVDSSGIVIFASNEKPDLGPYVSAPSRSTAVRRGVTGERGFLEEHQKNAELDQRFVVGYAPVEGTDWTVIKHVPAEDAYQIQTTVEWGLLILLGGALLGLLVFGLTIGRGTVQSVRTLSAKAATIEAGDYDVELESDRSDELGTLYKSIDGMRIELVSQIEEAKAARRKVEQTNEHLQLVDRLLRHNIYNRLTVAKLNAERAGELCSDDVKKEIQTLERTIDDIIEKVNKQRLITVALAQNMTPQPTDVGTDIVSLCRRVATEHPSAEITFKGLQSAEAVALPIFVEAVDELVDNAIRHNDTENPRIVVRVEVENEKVEVYVEDNGPGIPERERALIMGEKNADQLQHSSGVGLWMVRWVVGESGGHMTINKRVPHGSVVCITLHRPDTTAEGRDTRPSSMTVR
ncbi:ATP-binding protein [Halovenus rubra]|uniref:ATP-binding protein n=1 Tax=Halovenus rubra TaxID=869890 RepID=A0ACC7E0Z9_9EURY